MAVSTWFHGSQCPPGNHGIMPVSSCSEAIHSAVWTTSSEEIAPSTSGSRDMTVHPVNRRRVGLLLAGIDDVALAEHRRGGSLHNLQAAWLLGDLPLEHPPVGVDHAAVVSSHTDRALEPPVRRVQRVCVMAAGDGQSGTAELGLQLRCGVDAHVPTDGCR